MTEGRYHTNIHIDSSLRASGTKSNFSYVLATTVSIPAESKAFMQCTRWTVDVSGIAPADRRGRSLQMSIDEVDPSGQFIDMTSGGSPRPCVAYIPTLYTSFDLVKLSSLNSHPVAMLPGLSLRRFGVQVTNADGTPFDDGGEWEADFQLVVYM